MKEYIGVIFVFFLSLIGTGIMVYLICILTECHNIKEANKHPNKEAIKLLKDYLK